MKTYGHGQAGPYVRALLAHSGFRPWLSLALTVFLGLTQGVGLIMLLPLLDLIGLGGTQGPGAIAAHVGGLFRWLGLPLTLPSVLCLYMGIVAAHGIVSRYRDILDTVIVYGLTKALRDRLYRGLCQVGWQRFLQMKMSDVTHVLTGDLQRVGFATQQLLQLAATVVIAGVHIAVAFMISASLTLLALACGVGILLILGPLNRRAHRAGEALRCAMNAMYSAVSEHLGGMKVAKSLGLETVNAEKFANITEDVTCQMVDFARVNATTRMYYEIGAAAILAGFFFVGLEMVALPASSLLLMVFLFARLLPRFSTIMQTVQRIANAFPSFRAVLAMERAFDEAKEPPLSETIKPIQLHGEVRLSKVSFRYRKDIEAWALKEVDTAIRAGSMTAVVGPSGAGKSTMADLLLGLLSPDSGQVTVDGSPLDGPLLHRWRRSVGYVPQETFLFHDTIRANLLWALPTASEADLWSALRTASADTFVSQMPHGLDTVVGDRGARLSGGERQRIALARALMRKPTLLLLDEATNSLDAENERRIHDAIGRLHGELTIVLISHRPPHFLRADRTLTLDRGRLVDTSEVP